MKRFFAILLSLAVMLALVACGNDGNGNGEHPTTATTPSQQPTTATTPNEPLADVKNLIAQGKYEEAYQILYANKSVPEAKELLKDFGWVWDKMVSTDSKGNVATCILSYYAEENRMKCDVTYPDGDKCVAEYFYDASGNMLKYLYTESNGRIVSKEYTYDANGNVLKYIYKDSEDSYNDESQEWTYDTYGNIKSYTDSKGSHNYEYTYDTNGNKIKEVRTVSGEYVYLYAYIKEERTYDANRNMTKEVFTDYKGDISTYEYIYDANGNKTKQVHTDSRGDVSI